MQSPFAEKGDIKEIASMGITTRHGGIEWLSSQYKSGTLAFYARHAQRFFTSTVQQNLKGIYAPFLNELSSGARILDAGCGSGRDTKAFLSKGYQVKAMDCSPELAQMATTFTGQKCEVVSFEEMDFDDEFDGIWACASLLHIPRAEISVVLQHLAKGLKRGGVLFVSLKEGFGECVAEDGRFFKYYTLHEFADLLTERGRFKITNSWKSRDLDSSGQMQGWLNYLARKIY